MYFNFQMQLPTRIKVNCMQVFSGIDSGPHLTSSQILYFVLCTSGHSAYLNLCNILPKALAVKSYIMPDSFTTEASLVFSGLAKGQIFACFQDSMSCLNPFLNPSCNCTEDGVQEKDCKLVQAPHSSSDMFSLIFMTVLKRNLISY